MDRTGETTGPVEDGRPAGQTGSGQTPQPAAKVEDRAWLERQFRSLLEFGRDALFTVDREGRFVLVNAAAERLSGYSAEELSRAKEEAEAASRAKDRFLAALSHELRTPLTPVAMAVAAMESDPDLPPRLRRTMAMVRRNVELEARLIDDLLDLSRAINGKLSLQLQPARVHELLRHVLDICAAEIEAQRLDVRCEWEAAPDQVMADPARLQQVFWNLLKNAVKFTNPGGRIAIRTRNDPAGYLVVEVQDTGMGIAPDVLGRIFTPFEQGHASVTRQYGGMGLGLAISKSVVELHGGTIEARSEGAGRGATFTVKLPASTPALETLLSAGPQPGAADHVVARVLVVEDHVDTAKLLGQLLRSFGHVVRTTGTVAGALKLASDEPFEVMLSDLGLPDGDGYDLMRQIKRLRPMPGIAMSGHGMEADVRKSREAGFSDHLTKPINAVQVDEAIQRVLRCRNKNSG